MSQVNNVKEFIDKVQWLNEVDYGDFKRKVGLYINRLDEAYPKGQRSQKVDNVIATMKDRTLYHSEGDIEDTRFKVVELAKLLLN